MICDHMDAVDFAGAVYLRRADLDSSIRVDGWCAQCGALRTLEGRWLNVAEAAVRRPMYPAVRDDAPAAPILTASEKSRYLGLLRFLRDSRSPLRDPGHALRSMYWGLLGHLSAEPGCADTDDLTPDAVYMRSLRGGKS